MEIRRLVALVLLLCLPLAASSSSLRTKRQVSLPSSLFSPSVTAARRQAASGGGFAAPARTSSTRLLMSGLPLRASPDIIPPDIVEIPNPLLDPKPDDLDVQKLLALMGDDFDRELMAIEQPLTDIMQFPNGHLEYAFRSGHTLPDELQQQQQPQQLAAAAEAAAAVAPRLFDSDDIRLGPDGPVLRLRLSRRTRQKLQRIVWAYSYCPVRYKWKQLHQRFWPRWIRQGSCDRTRSCSLPAGMQCQPKAAKDVKILRFHCPYGDGGVRVCRWIKFNYPILTECSCGCGGESGAATGRSS